MYEGINSVANDYVLKPIGVTDEDLVYPFSVNNDFNSIAEEVDRDE